MTEINRARQVANLGADIISVKDFGAVGDGITNDTLAIQAAIDAAAAASSRKVCIPQGIYNINSTLTANVGVLFYSQTNIDLTTNTNGSGQTDSRPIIVWTGAANGYMFQMNPVTTGDIIFGGGVEGIEWDGGTLADVAVNLDNTKYSTFSGKIRNVRYAGLLVSSNSGSVSNFSMKNQIKYLDFVWGTADACKPAIGLLLTGNGSTVPSTQQMVGNITGLVYDGSLVEIQETDNAQFLSVHGIVQSGGAGKSVTIKFAGAQPSNSNFFMYVVGPIAADSGVYGNSVLNYNSEGGGITQLAGTSEWHGELMDYGTGERFKTLTYKLRDKLELPGTAFEASASATITAFSTYWTCITFPDSVDSGATITIPTPYHWNDGTIKSIDVLLSTNGTSGGNYSLITYLSTGDTAGIITTPEKSISGYYAAGSQHVSKLFNFSMDLSYTKGDHIFLTVFRLGTDVLDTNTDPIIFLGAKINYVSDGPVRTPGGGTYTIPDWT